jgi:chromosomal replication initiation ATPase DnaA
MTLTAEQIIDTIAQGMEFNVEDIMYKKTQKSDMTTCRHLIYYFLHKYVRSKMGKNRPIEYTTIASMFNKHHATIIYAIEKVENYINYNSEFRALVDEYEQVFCRIGNPKVCTFCGSLKENIN